jgi:hypothetical protein
MDNPAEHDDDVLYVPWIHKVQQGAKRAEQDQGSVYHTAGLCHLLANP